MTEAKTISVPEAGKIYFGLGRGASFAAAGRGQIPTIRVGRLLRVPVAAMERMMAAAGNYVVEAQTEHDRAAALQLEIEAERRRLLRASLEAKAHRLRAELAEVERLQAQ